MGGAEAGGSTGRPLSGRVAWVTGGASGIGRAIALALARAGADVAIGSLLDRDDWSSRALTYRPGERELHDTVAELRNNDVASTGLALDVRSTQSIRRCHDGIRDALGSVDILVNAAGVGRSELLVDHDEETWVTTVEVNLNGAYRTIRSCLPEMVERSWGRIVNVASTAASVGHPGSSAYCASKAGLLGLTRCAALEGARHNVTCNAISPGQVDTASTRLSFHNWANEEGIDISLGQYNDEWARSQPQGRLIEPREIAGVAAFLCRDGSLGVSGQDITVAGAALW